MKVTTGYTPTAQYHQDGPLARTTIRLPAKDLELYRELARKAGQSLNRWLVETLHKGRWCP